GELFNGNIRNMTTSIEEFMDPYESFGTKYTYDQLNRIKKMESFQDFDKITNKWGSNNQISSHYNTGYSYDPNGNIERLERNNSGGSKQDGLFYKYPDNKNYLKFVHDKVTSTTINYTYDSIGNLIKEQEGSNTTNIDWNLYGKIMHIIKSNDTISFTYDPTGNRIKKDAGDTTLWYVGDATGNVMAIYLLDNTSNKFYLKEYPIYGSKRIASNKINKELTGTVSNDDFVFKRADKQFELSNHLGNVLTTVSDKKLQVVDDNNVFTHFKADVLTANDYYPFGMQMDNRNYSLNSSEHIYGFNGKEMDNEVSGSGNQYDYGFRIYNSRIAKFLSVDPLTNSYPWYTPYQFAGNKPINSIDLDGLEEHEIYAEIDNVYVKIHNYSNIIEQKKDLPMKEIIRSEGGMDDWNLIARTNNGTDKYYEGTAGIDGVSGGKDRVIDPNELATPAPGKRKTFSKYKINLSNLESLQQGYDKIVATAKAYFIFGKWGNPSYSSTINNNNNNNNKENKEEFHTTYKGRYKGKIIESTYESWYQNESNNRSMLLIYENGNITHHIIDLKGFRSRYFNNNTNLTVEQTKEHFKKNIENHPEFQENKLTEEFQLE
ncbi:hypothetical protein OAJ56_01595, partial [Flavobacteriales bacterium]|nr:hypothetical protein [Flavobacteriales bacterium]